MVGRALLDELLLVLTGDEELRGRLQRTLVPLVAEALRNVVAGDYVDRREAARMNVEWRAVRRAAGRGELRLCHVGRRHVVARCELLAWIEGRAVNSPGREADETRVSSLPESGDSFEIAIRRAEKRRRTPG